MYKNELITVGEIIQNIRARWIAATLLALAIALVGVGLIFLIPEKYEARALVEFDWGKPPSSEGLLSSALPSLLGGSSQDDQLRQGIALMESRDFVVNYIDQHKLLPLLFPKLWDAQAQKWKQAAPTPLAGYDEFLDILNIQIDDQSQFLKFRLRYADRDTAIDILRTYIEDARAFLRERQINKSRGIVNVVENFLKSSQSEVVRQVVAEAAKDEIGKRMFIEIDPTRPLRVIDQANASESPAWPNKRLIALLTAFFVIVGVTVVGLFPRRHG